MRADLRDRDRGRGLLEGLDRTAEAEAAPARREAHVAGPDGERRIRLAPGRGEADLDRRVGCGVGVSRLLERAIEQQAAQSDLRRQQSPRFESLRTEELPCPPPRQSPRIRRRTRLVVADESAKSEVSVHRPVPEVSRSRVHHSLSARASIGRRAGLVGRRYSQTHGTMTMVPRGGVRRWRSLALCHEGIRYISNLRTHRLSREHRLSRVVRPASDSYGPATAQGPRRRRGRRACCRRDGRQGAAHDAARGPV